MKFKIIPNEQTPKVERMLLSSVIISNRDRKLLEKFYSFARKQKNCVGLAANQCTVNGERIMKLFFAIKLNYIWDIMIDPYIVSYKGKKERKIESCLTWLGEELFADRYTKINVVYFNLTGEKVKKEISGLEAQIWQHEYDHLNGVKEKFSSRVK